MAVSACITLNFGDHWSACLTYLRTICHVLWCILVLVGVNAAAVTGVESRNTPIFDPQGSISVLDPCSNCYTITMRGRGREER